MPSLDVSEIISNRRGEEAALAERHMNPQFLRVLRTIGYHRTWVKGEGAYLVDDRGDRYLDLLGGYGVFSLGRNNAAVRGQLERFLAAETANLPQMAVTLLSGVLAEQLLARSPRSLGAVILCQSGAEAVEATIKMSRAATGRPRVLSASNSFHGLTTGALSLTDAPQFRSRFGPFLPGTDRVPFADVDALERELRAGDVAAFVVEPIQGKGVNIPPPDYLPRAQELCRRHGTLFALDEVQTGLGRTGRFLALEHWGLEPDMVTLSKALSGGYVPIGACLTSRAVHDAVHDSMERAIVHGSTFGTNDLAAAAGIAALSELDDAGLVERSRQMGELLLSLTRPLVEKYDVVRDVRGVGLMWAIEFGPPRGGASRRLWRAVERRQPGLFSQLINVPLFTEHRILTQVAGHRMNVVKAIPPLVIEESDIHMFARALDDVVGRAARLPSAMARFGYSMARRGARARRAPSAANGAGPVRAPSGAPSRPER